MKKTANPAYLPFKNDENNFDFFFLTALSGLVLFKLFFSFYFNWYPETKPREYLAYPLGWVLVPLAGWAFTLLLDKWRGEDTREGGFYPVLVTAQFILVLFLFHPRWMAHIGPFAQLGVFLMAEGTALAIARRKKPSAMDRDLLYGGMVCLASFWVLNVNTGLFKGPWSHPLACLLFLVVIGVFHLGYPRDAGPSRPATPWVRLPAVFLLYGIVLAVLAWTVLDPRFPYNKYHFGFYLGPLADLLNGKSLLNNINAQYGVMVFYFLKIFFAWMPLGYRSFSLVNMTLTVLQYFVFFITCRLLFKGWALPLLALSSLLLINHFAYVEVNPFFFPSTGPLRFGFLYLLPLLVLLRGRIPGWRNLFYALEAGLTALAFFLEPGRGGLHRASLSLDRPAGIHPLRTQTRLG